MVKIPQQNHQVNYSVISVFFWTDETIRISNLANLCLDPFCIFGKEKCTFQF